MHSAFVLFIFVLYFRILFTLLIYIPTPTLLHLTPTSTPTHPSEYGFMSFKLNTCTPAWMLSFETQQLYLKNIAYQKESIIFTQVRTAPEGRLVC